MKQNLDGTQTQEDMRQLFNRFDALISQVSHITPANEVESEMKRNILIYLHSQQGDVTKYGAHEDEDQLNEALYSIAQNAWDGHWVDKDGDTEPWGPKENFREDFLAMIERHWNEGKPVWKKLWGPNGFIETPILWTGEECIDFMAKYDLPLVICLYDDMYNKKYISAKDWAKGKRTFKYQDY